MSSKNNRKSLYDESFLKLGFTKLKGKSKRVICLNILFEESMKKNKLQWHLTRNYRGCIDKPIEFFEQKLYSLIPQKGIMSYDNIYWCK